MVLSLQLLLQEKPEQDRLLAEHFQELEEESEGEQEQDEPSTSGAESEDSLDDMGEQPRSRLNYWQQKKQAQGEKQQQQQRPRSTAKQR